MANIAYYRVSSVDQSTAAQKHAMLHDAGAEKFTREFSDEGISGAVLAAKRPGFAKLLAYIREGDTLHVYAVDRLGRDALDVQSTVRALLEKGVKVQVHGLGTRTARCRRADPRGPRAGRRYGTTSHSRTDRGWA